MKTRRKKAKISVMVRIIVVFLIALILSALATFTVSYRFARENTAKEVSNAAKAVASVVYATFGEDFSINRLYTNEKEREYAHDVFRIICEETGVRYLYIYVLDKDDHEFYIVSAGGTDEDDSKVVKDFSFGSIHYSVPDKAEINVFNGIKESDYFFNNNQYGDVCTYILPLKDDNGKVEALIGVDYPIDSITHTAVINMGRYMILDLVIIIIFFIIGMLILRRSVILPVSNLSIRMKNFVIDKANKTKDFPERFFDDEITDIEESFDEMAGDISKYLQDIESYAAEKASINAQLDVAKRIQNGIVPFEYSLSGSGYEVYGCVHPARDVGGDFYDIFRPDDNHICVVVGDISGKGVSAALFMVMVKTAIREKIKGGYSLAEALNLVNHEIVLSNPEYMFATVFAMMLNTLTGVLTYANAGHNPPVRIRCNSDLLDMKSGIALGIFDEADIVDEEIVLNDGEGMFIYTDGITESVNKENVQYGEDALLTKINEVCKANKGFQLPRILVNSIVDSVMDYAKGLEQFDDITCTALIFNKNEKEELSPDMDSFATVKQTMLESLGDNDKTRMMILACEEMFSNIVNYSGADSVRFSCERRGDTYSVTLSDNGVPFDPVKTTVKDKAFEELDTGGMGIMLARNNTKEMIYSRVKGRNILTLIFEIAG